MTASKLHWRLLTVVILILMAAALAAPKLVRPPDIQENRALAERPAWPRSYGEFADFRKGVDAWVADRFPARPHLLGALNRIRMMVGVSGSPKTLVGREGWLFYDDDTHLGSARGAPPWTEAEKRAWLTSLAGRTEYLRAQGIDYLVVAAPIKETVYPQFGPAWYDGPNPDRPAMALSRLAKSSGAGEVIYLHGAVAAATRAGVQTFSRHDTHWTGPGAHAGYAALMRRLQALGVTEGPRPLSDFRPIPQVGENQPRDLALMLAVASYVDVRYPRYNDPAAEAKNVVTWLTPRQDWTAPRTIDTGQVGKPVVLITLDSFANELLPLLYGHFSRLIVAHKEDGVWRQDLIERFKPDLVILQTVESGLAFSMNGAPAASAEALQRIAQVTTAPALPPPTTVAQAPVAMAPVAQAPAAPPAAPPVPVEAPPAAMGPATAAQTALLNPATPVARCNLEVATLTGPPGGPATLELEGWLTDLARPPGSGQGFARLQGPAGDFVAPLSVDRPRADVAGFFKAPEAAPSGFAQAYRLDRLPAGTYRATVYRPGTSGGWRVCRGTQTLVIR